MGDLAEALALIHNAHASVRTLTATLRWWADQPLGAEAFERGRLRRRARAELSADHHLVATAHLPASASARLAARPPVTEGRLWFRSPDLIRCEEPWPFGEAGEITLLVAQGDRWWWTAADGTARTGSHGHGTLGRVRLILDPSPLAGHRTTALGRTAVDGRACIRLAIPPPSDEIFDPDPLSDVVGYRGDDRVIDVDAERGILLRVASLIEGKEYAVLELRDLVIDGGVDVAMFVAHGEHEEASQGLTNA